MTVEEKDLQLVIAAYHASKIGDAEIMQVLCKLAEEVLACKNKTYIFTRIDDPVGAVKEAATYCFARLDKYNPEKGKAFNFFTTIILCYLRQVGRMSMNLEKLKDNHRKRKVGV